MRQQDAFVVTQLTGAALVLVCASPSGETLTRSRSAASACSGSGLGTCASTRPTMPVGNWPTGVEHLRGERPGAGTDVR
jgi:hypothetical protein